MCDETIYAVNILSTKLTNAIPTNVTSTMLTNSDCKKARRKMNCYVLHTVLLVFILLLIIAIMQKLLSRCKKLVKAKKR